MFRCGREGYDGSDNHRPAGSFINFEGQETVLHSQETEEGEEGGEEERDDSRGVGVI